MMLDPRAWAWARARTPADWLALASGLAVFGYVGWDGALWDARFQLLLHLTGLGAVVALMLYAARGGELPRTRIDVPLLALLAAFGLATVGALNVGMSLRAMAAIIGYAAMLPVALVALRHRPAWVGFVTAVPVLLLAIPTLVALLARRVEWIVAGAPGLPPLRLAAEGTPFGSVAVPPFVLVPAWALAALIEPAPLRRVVRIALVAVGVPLIILSGSRSAWLAIAAAALIGGLPWAWQRRERLRLRRRPTRTQLGLALGALALTVLGLMLVIPRLTAVTSLLYRAALWRDTLNAWSSDPLLGIGPGLMPYARQAAAPDFTFPVRQPHSHNLPLGLLGDAGLVGLAAGVALVVALAVVAGPWRSRTTTGRVASTVLVGLAIGGLFEDLTFVPGFNLLAIALTAVALLDAGAVSWVRPAWTGRVPRLAAAAGLAAGAVLLWAATVSDTAAIAYRAGTEAAADEAWADASDWLERAVAIDPWHPAGPRSLAVAADGADRADLARRAAEDAVLLNPGDATSWTNLALLCHAAGDASCAIASAERAAATAGYGRVELLNAALTLESLGEHAAADAAWRLSLLTQPLTAFASEWPRTVAIGDGRIADFSDPTWQLNLVIARRVNGEPIDPASFADDAVRAVAYAIAGDRAAAETSIDRALRQRPEEPRIWDLAIVLHDAWGMPVDDEIRVASTVRGRTFPPRDLDPAVARQVLDIGSFRAYPRDGLVASATRLGTRPPWPWVLEQILP